MKKYFVLLLMAFCTSSSYSQELLSDDFKYLGGETKDNVNFWTKTNLYYYIQNCAKDLTPTQCQTAIQNAFNIWSQYSNFTFTRTYTLSQADIEINWLTSPIFGVTDTIPAFSWIGYLPNRTPPSYIF